jgi:hypothetical protein
MRWVYELKGCPARTPTDTTRKTHVIENNNWKDDLIELTSDVKPRKSGHASAAT